MKQSEADSLVQNLASKFGIALKASVINNAEEDKVILMPDDIHPNDGFQIGITIGWRSLFFDLILGKFAADFLQQLAAAPIENKQIFSKLAQQIAFEKGIFTFRINESVADPLNPQSWPLEWKQLSLSLRKSPLEINTDNESLSQQLINSWTERFVGCVLALTPIEEVEAKDEVQGLPEGALTKILVNRYERSQYNRTICINFHGAKCKVCEFDFGQVYGELGQNFIHVHHIVPVSQLGTGYIINPIKDLVPVCPNCHSMLHRESPPISVEGLKSVLLASLNS